jgi:hypothetical protein
MRGYKIAEEISSSIGGTHLLCDPRQPYINDSNDEIDRHLNDDYSLAMSASFLEENYHFLPEITLYNLKQKRISRISYYTAILAVVGIIITALFFVIQTRTKTEKIIHLQSNIESIESSKEFNYIRNLQAGIDNYSKHYNQLNISSNWVSNLYRALSHTAPDNIHLVMIEAAEHGNAVKLRIEGYYYGDMKSSDIALVEFWQNLIETCGYQEVTFERMGEAYEGSLKQQRFILSGTLKRIGNDEN